MKHLHFNNLRRLAATLLVALLVPIGVLAQTVATPTIKRSRDYDNQVEREYYNPVEISFECETPGAEIYYEVSDKTSYPAVPTAQSTKYEGPITLGLLRNDYAWRFQVIAIKDGVSSSVAATTAYVHVAPAEFKLAGETIVNGNKYMPGNLSMSCATEGAEIYYEVSTDGTQKYSSTSSTKYTDPFYLDFSSNQYKIYAISHKEGVSRDRSSNTYFYVQVGDPEILIDGKEGSSTQLSSATYYNPVRVKITPPAGVDNAQIYYYFADGNEVANEFDKSKATLYTGEFDFMPSPEYQQAMNVTTAGYLRVGIYMDDKLVVSKNAYLFFTVDGQVELSHPTDYRSGAPFDVEVTSWSSKNEGAKLYYSTEDISYLLRTDGGRFADYIANGKLTACNTSSKIHVAKTARLRFYVYDERIDDYASTDTYADYYVAAESFSNQVDGTSYSDASNHVYLTQPVSVSFAMNSGSAEPNNTFRYYIIKYSETDSESRKNMLESATVWDGQPLTIDFPCIITAQSFNGQVYSDTQRLQLSYNSNSPLKNASIDMKFTNADGTEISTSGDNLASVADQLPLYATLSLSGNSSSGSGAGSGAGSGSGSGAGGGSATGDIYYTITTDGTEPADPTIANATKYVEGTKIPIDTGTYIKYVVYNSSLKLYGQYYKVRFKLQCATPRFTPNVSGDFWGAWSVESVLWETGSAVLANVNYNEKVYYNMVYSSESEELAKLFKRRDWTAIEEMIPDPTPENGTLLDGGYFIDGEYYIKAIAYRDGWEPSETFTDHHALELNDEATINPAAGRYDEPQKITFTDNGYSGAGGQHYYITIDGSDPATSDTRIMINMGRVDEKDVPDFYLDHSATVKWTQATAHYHTAVKSATYYIKASADLSFAQESYEAVVGEDFESPVLTNPHSLEVTWASANAKVATVDQQGQVTLRGLGTTRITANWKGDDTWRAATTGYTLYVTKVEPVTEDTEIALESSDLTEGNESGTIGDNTTYSFDTESGDSYDPETQTINLQSSLSVQQIEAIVEQLQPGSEDFNNMYNGLTVLLSGGKGTVEIECQTWGDYRLSVKIGDKEIATFEKTDRGTVIVNYDIDADTYAYIFALVMSSPAKAPQRAAARRAAANEYLQWLNAPAASRSARRAPAVGEQKGIAISGITVKPTEVIVNGIHEVEAAATVSQPTGQNYDLLGRRISKPTQKGVYIVDGKKVVIK